MRKALIIKEISASSTPLPQLCCKLLIINEDDEDIYRYIVIPKGGDDSPLVTPNLYPLMKTYVKKQTIQTTTNNHHDNDKQPKL